jgi:MFS family permease
VNLSAIHQTTPRSAAEFAAGWPVLLGAVLGIGVGIFAIPVPAIGVFMRAMQADLGWTRTEISLGPTLVVIVLALTSPLVGWLADRVCVARISAVALSALAGALFLCSRIGPSVWTYYAACAGMALAACGTSTLIYARALSANFEHARGFALGLAMVGNGITSIFLPMLLAPYAAEAGWRSGFVALAIVVALATPLVAFLMSKTRALPTPSTGRTRPADSRLESVVRDRAFWTMATCFALIPLAASGLQVHLLAFLSDVGVTPAKAGAIASISGAALIATRVLTGWLLDLVRAPYVAAVMMALSALCIAAMALFGAPAAPLGAIAFGLSIGAEIDLIGYMTGRYFGMRAFGRVYGLLYAAALLGGAGSPLLYGAIFDATGSYQLALWQSAGMLLASAVLFLTLPRAAESPQ